jgi:hypothetical protein
MRDRHAAARMDASDELVENGDRSSPTEGCTPPPDAAPDAFALARAAGLGKAVDQFPDCVTDAARVAAQERTDMPEVDGTGEPWPPMQIRSGR